MKVVIVGGGIAGLVAGIYAKSSGFDTILLEMHSIAGGSCTSWRREGYLFEGGMHWLTGSSPQTGLHKLWRQVGAIDDDTVISNKDPYLTCTDDGREYHLYRDADRSEHYLLGNFPVDGKMIKSLYKDIRRFQAFAMPVMDVKGARIAPGSEAPKADMLKMLRVMPRMMKLGKVPLAEYIAQFKSPILRTLLSGIVPEGYGVTSMMFTLATLANGDGGYLQGGSLAMAQNMLKRYESLGGRVEFGTKVDSLRVENGRASGVQVGERTIEAEAVIVASDTRVAIDRMFEMPLDEEWAQQMRQTTIPQSCTFICIGIDKDISHLSESLVFPLEQPLELAGQAYSSIGLNNYAAYDGYAPEGCSACTAALTKDSYDFWQKAKKMGEYDRQKELLSDRFTQQLESKMPELKGSIKVIDIATPLTYQRYCGTYRGSWMTLMPADARQTQYPVKPESCSNVYFAGHRMMMPGGMPVAIATGRTAVQQLCLDNGVEFAAPLD